MLQRTTFAWAACVTCLVALSANAGEKTHTFLSSTKMIDAEIKNAQNETIATISDVVLNRDGKALYAIASVGGVVGIGAEMVAIPVKALGCDCKLVDGEKTCHATLKMTETQLKRAPTVKKDYVRLADIDWCRQNCEFFRVEAPEKAPLLRDLIAVSKIAGLTVRGAEDESVGELNAVVFEMGQQKAVYAVISHGGTLGLNESYTAVPFKSIRVVKDGEERLLSINTAKATVKAAPRVTPSEYKELDREDVRERIDSAFASE